MRRACARHAPYQPIPLYRLDAAPPARARSPSRRGRRRRSPTAATIALKAYRFQPTEKVVDQGGLDDQLALRGPDRPPAQLGVRPARRRRPDAGQGRAHLDALRRPRPLPAVLLPASDDDARADRRRPVGLAAMAANRRVLLAQRPRGRPRRSHFDGRRAGRPRARRRRVRRRAQPHLARPRHARLDARRRRPTCRPSASARSCAPAASARSSRPTTSSFAGGRPRLRHLRRPDARGLRRPRRPEGRSRTGRRCRPTSARSA